MIIGTLRLKANTVASPSKGKGRLADSDDEDTENERETANSTRNESVMGWAYVGSHNFTPSAWGTLSGTSSKPSLNVSPNV